MKKWLKRCLIAGAILAFLLALTLLVFPGQEADPTQFKIGRPLPSGKVVPQLAGDANISMLLAPDGSLWAWGAFAQPAGRGFRVPTQPGLPKKMSVDSDWLAVATSMSRIQALKMDGSLWEWIPSGIGWPPRIDGPAPMIPTRIGADSNWVRLTGGATFNMALKNDGSLWAWGGNNYNQLGDGTTNSQTVPIQVGADHDWKAISAGSFNAYALKKGGTVWGWGLGIAGGNEKINDPVPKQIDADTNWTAISAGNFHLMALKADGTLWIRGQNAGTVARDYASRTEAFKQIGTDHDWSGIYSGPDCFFARKKDGSWWACGYNPNGKLGVKASNPSSAGARGNVVSRRQDLVTSLQRLPIDFEPWAFGTFGPSTLMLSRDGSLWTWGERLGWDPSVQASSGIRGVYGNVVLWLGAHFSSSRQALPVANLTGRGLTVDASPYRLWTLPREVRRSLGKDAPSSTGNPALPK